MGRSVDHVVRDILNSDSSVSEYDLSRISFPKPGVFLKACGPSCRVLSYRDGFPDELPLSEEMAKGHPLEGFIRKGGMFSSKDLFLLGKTPDMDLSIVGYTGGALPATYREGLAPGSQQPHDYSRNMWGRDGVIAALGIAAAERKHGHLDRSVEILRAPWEFIGASTPVWNEGTGSYDFQDSPYRGHISSFHFSDNGDPQQRLRSDNACDNYLWPIKFSIDDSGHLVALNHPWDQRQLDAWSAMIREPYALVNEAFRKSGLSVSEFNMPFDFHSLDPIPRELLERRDGGEFVLCSAIKSMNRARVWDLPHRGMWEDKLQIGTGGLLVLLSAMDEVYEFHDRFGWDYFKVSSGTGPTFKEEVLSIREHTLSKLRSEHRIDCEGCAWESGTRPLDTAMIVGAFPFMPKSLNEKELDSIIRACYRCMRPEGFVRWAWDRDSNPGHDAYIGEGYNMDPDPCLGGEFARMKETSRPMRWTLQDAALLGFFSERAIRSYQESGGRYFNLESLERASGHLKRCLSFITPHNYSVVVAGKGYQRFDIPKGRFVEGWVFNPAAGRYEPCYNGELPMALGIFASGLEKLLEATLLYEKLMQKHLPNWNGREAELKRKLGLALWKEYTRRGAQDSQRG